MKSIRYFLGIYLACLMHGCVEEPVKEDIPEFITKLTLTFTPAGGGSSIEVSASDPDGEGLKDIEPDGDLILIPNETYTLSLNLINELADPTSPEYNITGEVEEEGDEHLFFYAWTNNIFSSPTGNGNVDNRDDDLDYGDVDDNGLPIGLITTWSVASGVTEGTFRVLLKHQPGIKSTTSTALRGETDLDITFNIQIQ
jgi:hypothetical protein